MKIKTKRSTIKVITIALSIITLVGLLTFHFYIPRLLTEIRNPLVSFVRGEHLITTTPAYQVNTDEGRKITFNSFDQTQLVAYETFSQLDTTFGSIILLHGIKACKENFHSVSTKLAKRGFNVVALDLRAHGESGGKNCTYGVFENKDVSKLVDLLSEEKPQIKIGILGQSLGGAIALQTLEKDKRLFYGIIESTFSDLKTITHDYFNNYLGFRPDFLINYLLNRSAKIANFNPDDASPINSCMQIGQPVLMVHGKEDRRINIKYGKANFKNLKNKESEFMEIKDANHNNVRKKAGDKYFEKIVSFAKENSK